jgi:hypothetical protein
MTRSASASKGSIAALALALLDVAIYRRKQEQIRGSEVSRSGRRKLERKTEE